MNFSLCVGVVNVVNSNDDLSSGKGASFWFLPAPSLERWAIMAAVAILVAWMGLPHDRGLRMFSESRGGAQSSFIAYPSETEAGEQWSQENNGDGKTAAARSN